jgi:hypothetical protein
MSASRNEHLHAPLPRRDPNFLDYWQILQPSRSPTSWPMPPRPPSLPASRGLRAR